MLDNLEMLTSILSNTVPNKVPSYIGVDRLCDIDYI